MGPMIRGLLATLLFVVGIALCRAESLPIEQRFAGSLTTMLAEPLTVSGAVYVPAYSSVSISQGNARADFAVTLSIHNASETRPLVIKRIAYFDTAGKAVDSYLKFLGRSSRHPSPAPLSRKPPPGSANNFRANGSRS